MNRTLFTLNKIAFNSAINRHNAQKSKIKFNKYIQQNYKKTITRKYGDFPQLHGGLPPTPDPFWEPIILAFLVGSFYVIFKK